MGTRRDMCIQKAEQHKFCGEVFEAKASGAGKAVIYFTRAATLKFVSRMEA